MFEKMIGVSPPQKGPAQDSKVANVKDFRDTPESKSKYKSDFENALNAKMHKPKEIVEKKKELAKKEDLKVAKKENKSSGGIKKKVTDVDEKMVSSGMVSIENEVETPVSKNEEELAKIEVNTEKAEGSGVVLKAVDAFDQSNLKQLDFDEENLHALKNIEQAIDATTNQKTVEAENNSFTQFEAELSEAVGFKPNAETQASNKEITQKLKAFEGEIKNEASTTQSFEKNVLSQLQKENSFNSNAFSQQQSGSEQGQLEKDNKSDLKLEPNANQLHQAAGQSHASFKNHLEATAMGSGAVGSAGLEENREANINEIMNQAQYLVKKGGGEMNVKMSPDGLGEVNLKVHLLDGKINIEMQTQDKEVKKLIEDSLSELKSGLAAHRLSLEHVKIDSVNATNADNNTQMQSNLNQGGSEQRSREMWNEANSQMNQNSRERSSMFEGSRSASISNAVATPRVAPAQAARTYGGTKGATINRVA